MGYSTEINREKSASEFKFHKMARYSDTQPTNGRRNAPAQLQSSNGRQQGRCVSLQSGANPEPTRGTNPSPATGCPPDGHRRRSNANGRHDALQQMQPKRNDVFAYRF